MIADVTNRLAGLAVKLRRAHPMPSSEPRDVATISVCADPPRPASPRGHLRPSLVSGFAAFSAAPLATMGALITRLADAVKPGPSTDDQASAILAKDLPGWASTAGQLSQADVDKAVADPKVTGDDAAALAALGEHFDDLAKPHQGKFVTAQDIATGHLGKTFADNQKLLKTASKDFFNGPLDYRTLQQGDAGDCYFLSALDDEVRFHPDRVAGWSQKNPDGTLTVTFPYHFVSPQKVGTPTESEICLHASSGPNGTWVTDYETAWENALYPGQGRKGEDGQDPVLGVEAVTGHAASDEEIPSVSLADIHKQLTDAFADPANPKIVEVSTYDPPSPDKKDDGPTRTYTNGLVESHAYSLQGYDPKTRLVTIRNPWGSNPPTDAVKDLGNGEFTYTLQQMIDQFEMLTLEGDTPAPNDIASAATAHAKKAAV